VVTSEGAAHFTGVLQVDAMPGASGLTASGGARVGRLRRKSYEFHEATRSPIAAEALRGALSSTHRGKGPWSAHRVAVPLREAHALVTSISAARP